MARAGKPPIPITIVAGPRGAGKTTLINRLLDNPAFANSAVILNDFGEVALKNALVETAADSFVAFGSGCVCCTVRGALTDGLEKLLRDLDNGRVAAIGRVVIEADAAADPSAIFAAVERHPYLSLRYVAGGIVAVLDATTAEAARADSADTVRQVALAGAILLSRIEVADDMLLAALRQLNASAEIDDAAKIPATALANLGVADPETMDVEAWLGGAALEDPAGTLKGEAARIRAFAVERERIIPFAALERFLDYLMALQGPRLLRVRGLVATSENEAVVVDGAGGFFRPPLILDRPALPLVRFSVVARDLDRATFETYLDAFLDEARIDSPDRTALIDNPLVVPGFSARSGR
jgi:G3E family GTPase